MDNKFSIRFRPFQELFIFVVHLLVRGMVLEKRFHCIMYVLKINEIRIDVQICTLHLYE